MQENSGWIEEMQSAYLYKVVAEKEKVQSRKQLFLKLAHEAEHQAKLWTKEAKKAGLEFSEEFHPSVRINIIAWLIRTFGPEYIKPILAAAKIRGLSVYSSQRQPGHPIHTSVEEVGSSHRGSGSSGGLRAAVFGVNDGLVSIACLVLGVAGAAASSDAILLTGVAGLLDNGNFENNMKKNR